MGAFGFGRSHGIPGGSHWLPAQPDGHDKAQTLRQEAPRAQVDYPASPALRPGSRIRCAKILLQRGEVSCPPMSVQLRQTPRWDQANVHAVVFAIALLVWRREPQHIAVSEVDADLPGNVGQFGG